MVGETPASLNFEFLREHDALLLRLCLVAERSFTIDPNTTVLKLRQFGEALARNMAAVFGIDVTPELSQIELLGTLQRRGHLDRDVAALLPCCVVKATKLPIASRPRPARRKKR